MKVFKILIASLFGLFFLIATPGSSPTLLKSKTHFSAVNFSFAQMNNKLRHFYGCSDPGCLKTECDPYQNSGCDPVACTSCTPEQ